MSESHRSIRFRGATKAVARVGLVVASVLGMIVVGAAAMPAESAAAPRGNVVVLGDSFATNPPFFTNVGPGCHENSDAWPRRLAAITGKRVNNFACANATLSGGYNIYDEAQKARHAIGKDTRAVLVQVGFNDFGGGLDFLASCYVTGCPGGEARFPRMTSNAFASRLKPLVDYIRYYAPNAKIALVGYPELYAAGQRDMCVKLPGGAAVTRPGSSAHPAFMRKIERVQADSAKRLRIGFVSLATATRGQGMCAADAWVTGYFHPFEGVQTRIQGHPTATGDRVAARTVKRVVGL